MKNVPPVGSVECWSASRMFAPCSNRKRDTAATIPRLSGHEISSRAVFGRSLSRPVVGESAVAVIGLRIVGTWHAFVTAGGAQAKIEQMQDRDQRSDAQLLAATATDADAFGVFYRRHVRWVLAVCARRGRDPELAADVTAEVFATALAASDRFEPARGPAGGWLFGIALNKLADAQRRGHAERRARQRLGIPSIALTDDDIARIDELASLVSGGDVAQLLAPLPPEQRAAIHARIVQEREYHEIAGELDLSEAAVRQRVSRGLATLRARMRADGRTGS